MKWRAFYEKLENYINNKKYRKQLVNTLDDKKQWAPLHYAVFMNNNFVCDCLAGKTVVLNEPPDETFDSKDFRCGLYHISIFKNYFWALFFHCQDINILTGNGENVLHIAARSSSIWKVRIHSLVR
jgi:ankyrin repeat protein